MGASARRVLPTICVNICNVLAVSAHCCQSSAGQVPGADTSAIETVPPGLGKIMRIDCFRAIKSNYWRPEATIAWTTYQMCARIDSLRDYSTRQSIQHDSQSPHIGRTVRQRRRRGGTYGETSRPDLRIRQRCRLSTRACG